MGVRGNWGIFWCYFLVDLGGHNFLYIVIDGKTSTAAASVNKLNKREDIMALQIYFIFNMFLPNLFYSLS